MSRELQEFGRTLTLRVDDDLRERINTVLRAKRKIHAFLGRSDFLRELCGITHRGVITAEDRLYIAGVKESDSATVITEKLLQITVEFTKLSEADQSDLEDAIDNLSDEVGNRLSSRIAPTRGSKKIEKPGYKMLRTKTG